MEATISCSERMWSPHIFVLQRYFPPAVPDSIFLSHCVLECLTARTASFGLEEEKTNMVAARLSGSVFSMLTSSARLGFVFRGSLSNEQDPTCKHRCAPHLISFRSAQSKNKLSLFSWSALSCNAHPLLHNPEFLYLSPFFFPPGPVFSLSLVPDLHSSAWKAGWAITRGLRAGWLPLIESSQQIVFHETAQSSRPARTCPDITRDHTVSWRSLVCVRPTGFWTIAPFRTHLSAPDPQQQVEKQTTVRTWANMHGAPVTLEEAVPACWQEFMTHPGRTQIPQKHTHTHMRTCNWR